MKVIFILFFLFTGCTKINQTENKIENKLSEESAQCTKASNKEGNPCQVSIYTVTGFPEKWSGMYLEFLAYAPGNDVRLVFINKDASEFEDYQSSFLISGGEESKIEREGYVFIRAKFENDRRDYGVASGTKKQIGVLSEITVKRHAISISKRRSECSKSDCWVRHLDGK